MRRLLLQTRRLLRDAREPLFEGALFIVGGRIDSVLRGKAAVARRARAEGLVPHDLGEALLTPGLVNAHAHLELSGLSGRVSSEGSFPSWIGRLLAQRAPLEASAYERAVCLGADRLLETGTTTVGDISSAGVSERVLARHPLRAVVQREVLDAGDPARSDAAFDRVRRALPARVSRQEGLSPHAPYSVSPPLLARLAELARRRRLGIAVHWAETAEEVRWLREGAGPFADVLGSSPGASGLELLARAGLLEGRAHGEPLALIHGNEPEPGDPERVARAGGLLVHCPGTHAFFGRAPFALRPWLDAGVRLALGTDSLASNADLDMTREMALFRRAHPELAPSRVLELATLGGALALGLDGLVGECRAGAWADLVTWQIADDCDPLEALSSGAAAPAGVWIAGRRLL